MFKYISILIVLLFLFGRLQLVEAGHKTHKYWLSDYFKHSENKYYNNVLPCPTKEVMLVNSWKYYKRTFISDDGRVIDHQRGSVTTSEGQAYAMRRALLMRDKETFDKTYNWAKYNLQHKHDSLFAWLWGPEQSATKGKVIYKILDQNGAPDAGVEMAACLFLASRIWKQTNYREDAQKMINDIWNKETVKIKGERILISGVNQNRKLDVEINPSYFMYYSFRIFAQEDKAHDWNKLVDSSYRLTNWCINNIESGLPPDFFYMNRFTGKITLHPDRSDFSYDAIRVFYRAYIDYSLTKDPRALKTLARSNFFLNRWKRDGKFYTNYEQNGDIKDYDESIGSIALLLPLIKMYDKQAAKEIYASRIKAKCYKTECWGDPINYYAQNLVWFGNWLYLNENNIKLFKY